jgi:stage III sporulation protein SpoIIIAA
VGLTCRVGRAVTGHIDMIRDILDGVLRMLCMLQDAVQRCVAQTSCFMRPVWAC